MYQKLAVAVLAGYASALKTTPIDMSMYSGTMFAQTGSKATYEQPKCTLKVHSILPDLSVPKVQSVDEYPSFLKNRLARRASEGGDVVPDYLHQDESQIEIQSTQPDIFAPVAVHQPVAADVGYGA